MVKTVNRIQHTKRIEAERNGHKDGKALCKLRTTLHAVKLWKT